MSTQTEITIPQITEEEQVIVDSLLTSNSQISEVLPDNMPPDDIWKTLTACTKSLLQYRKSVSMLKPVVGRLVIILKSRPEVYKSWGYSSFDDLMSRGLYQMLGIPRSEAYAAKRLVEAWPSLSMEDMKKVSYSKLTEITKIGVSEDSEEANDWLTAAQETNLDGLKDLISQKKGLPRAALDNCVVSIVVSKEDRDFWNKICEDGRIQSTVGSASPGKIFMSALDVAYREWVIESYSKNVNDRQ